jgi:hypothetical protein
MMHGILSGSDHIKVVGAPQGVVVKFNYSSIEPARRFRAVLTVNALAISLPETKVEIERIEDAVSHIRFPLTFMDQLYFRSHIEIVRRRIACRANAPGSMVAE